MKLRFAPSPTGYLHVGGARTALFNWLLARQRGGSLLLRIEDTDRDRSNPAHVEAIVRGLDWLGLTWDEGPVFQADGAERHRQDGIRLLREGKAYRDFTSQEHFASARAEAVAAGTGSVARLPRTLATRLSLDEAERRAARGEPHAVRFRVPEGTTEWEDLVHGPLRFSNSEIEDFVILRSDGTPTYNLAVVSDDADAEITHVLRGDDHLSNTPKQILLCRALGREIPEFGHLPMILGPGGGRLSKRHGAQSVGSFREEGILPEAMVNYLALLGWSPGTDRDVLSRDELVARFSVERILKKGSVFDHEKLRWLNGQYIARMDPSALADLLRQRLADEGIEPLPDAAFARLTAALAPRSRTLADMAAAARPYLAPLAGYDPKAVRKIWRRDPGLAARVLASVSTTLASVPWEEKAADRELRRVAEELEVGAGKVFQPVRLALTGRAASPGIFDVLMILGRRRSLRRVAAALDFLRNAETDCHPPNTRV